MSKIQSPLRLAVLISGGGTTLFNLLARQVGGALDAEIVLVISSTAAARGLQFARDASVETLVCEHRNYANDEAFSEAIFGACRHANVGLVAMAGFLKFAPIPEDFRNRVMNIHPALIPAFCGQGFYGHRVHQAVLDYGAKLSGCTVHFVDNQYDHGPIILQRPVPVETSDTATTLAARVFEAECDAFPDAINLYAAGRLRVNGRIVSVM